MAAKSIQYNGFDLQTSSFRTRDIISRNLPQKIIDLSLLSRRDGFRLTNSYYTEKNIRIIGTVSSDTEANLRTSVDSMKEALHVDESNLDITEGGATIRWVCSVDNINIPEQHYHITRVPYNINFKCQPFGKETSSTNDSNSITQASADPYADTLDPTGSAPPRPILKWTVSGTPSSDITAISFNNLTTTDVITVSGLALNGAGEYLKIDTDAMTVVQNIGSGDVEVDFTGVFPTFKATSNSYEVTITGGGATFTLDQDIDYFASYI